MTQEDYIILTKKNREHKVFNSDWEIYYSIDFAATLLPEIPLYRGNALWVFDGAELFAGSQKAKSRVLDIEGNGTLINLIAYTYPKDVKASTRKQFVQAAKSEVCLFAEVAQDDSIELSFTLGKRFKDYLNSLSSEGVATPTPADVESQTYSTTITNFKAFFSNQLVHEDLMRYVFFILGIKKLFDEDNFEFNFPDPDTLSYEDIEPERKDDDFLEKIEVFIKTVSKGSLKNFDCVAQFYRSKEQMEDNLGINDVGYTGSFGFQRYNESTDGDGQLSLKYFPDFVIDKNNTKYKIPFLFLWSPKSRTVVSNNIPPISKATLWCRFNIGADSSHNAGVLYYDTGTPKVRINHKQKGTIYKSTNETPFTFGDNVSFDVTCVDTLTDYAFVVFRETDSSGKIIGILTVVPNNSIYKTEVNIVDIKLGYDNRFISDNINHPMRQPLLKHFNENSFNQSLISIDITPNYKTLSVNRNHLPRIEIDNNGKPFIKRDNRDAFNEAIKRAYNDALVEKSGDITENLLRGIRDSISSIEKLNAFARKKRLLKRTALQLINLLIKKFERYSKQDYAYTRTFEDLKVLKAIAVYTEERDTYRKELFEAVDNRFKDNIHYKSLDNHKIKEAVMLGKDVTTLGENAASINPIHSVYIFLYKDIHSFKDSADARGEVAGFATNGDGFCHIFNLALNHKTQRDELIAHEVGHAFGLKHTFDYTKEKIDEEYQKKLKEIKDERDKEDAKKSIEGGNFPIQFFIKRYNDIKNEINAKGDILFLDLDINEKIIEQWKNRELEANKNQEVLPYYQKKYIRDKEALDNQYRKNIENTLNLKQAQTQENYMDYDIPKRKSFWYWQWKEMQKNVKLLEEVEIK